MGACFSKWKVARAQEAGPAGQPAVPINKTHKLSGLVVACSPSSQVQVPRAGLPRSVPKSTLLVKNIKTLATFNEDLGELHDAAVFVKGNVIAWVGPTADLPDSYKTADTVLCGKDKIVIPGLVNSHHHMWQCLTRTVGTVRQLNIEGAHGCRQQHQAVVAGCTFQGLLCTACQLLAIACQGVLAASCVCSRAAWTLTASCPAYRTSRCLAGKKHAFLPGAAYR